MTATDGLVISGIFAGWAILNIYGEWYWRSGRGYARKARRAIRRHK